MDPIILILGASARAAAFSAIRGGLRPRCGDLFADDDLRQRCPTRRATEYPAGLAAIAAEWPVAPWIYTGAVENYPEVIERIAIGRETWGNSAAIVRAVRDPWRLRSVLSAAGMRAPELRPHDAPPAGDGAWLRKRRRSGGGAHVVEWREPSGAAPTEEWFFQRRIQGLPLGATFLSGAGWTELVGVAEQLIGAEWCGVAGFRYAGSLGPTPLSPDERAWLTRMGDALTNGFGLRGVWGVDVMRDASGEFWPVEVNPRLPASAELHELATGRSLVGEHVAACRGEAVAAWDPSPTRAATAWRGKAIVHARHDLLVDEALNAWLHSLSSGGAELVAADIPCVGEPIRAGQPLVTVFAVGGSRAATLRELQSLVAAATRSAAVCRMNLAPAE